jgi:predicted CopG family antitoxin
VVVVVMVIMVTINVERETHEKLKEIGKKGESYDAIIQRLIKDMERIERGRGTEEK